MGGGEDEGGRALAGAMLAHVIHTALCMCMPASYSELVTEIDNYRKIFLTQEKSTDSLQAGAAAQESIDSRSVEGVTTHSSGGHSSSEWYHLSH